MQFYLGSNEAGWLSKADVPLFVSRRRFRTKKKPRAISAWALDSGAFTELKKYGHWTIGPEVYAEEARTLAQTVGRMDWAACQDWMCEPIVINGGDGFVGTKLSVLEHQRRTVANYLQLQEIAPEIGWLPVVQGFTEPEYMRCLRMYEQAGVKLASLPTVGLGSICRRQGTAEAESVIRALSYEGIRVHAFGFKVAGLRRVGPLLASADSMAWSYRARKTPPLAGCSHRHCNHCLRYALQWRQSVLDAVGSRFRMSLFD
jgi:hypothetical protein